MRRMRQEGSDEDAHVCEYWIDASYRDAAGDTHRAKLELDPFAENMDRNRDPAVRYLANKPGRLALLGALGLKDACWVSALFFVGCIWRSGAAAGQRHGAGGLRARYGGARLRTSCVPRVCFSLPALRR